MTFEQCLKVYNYWTPEQKAKAISDHEIRERRAFVRRSISLTEILEWSEQHPSSIKEVSVHQTIPKVGTIMPKTVIPKVEPILRGRI